MSRAATITFVVLAHMGRYGVFRTLPGTGGALAEVASCPTWQSAQRERDWQQAEHERQQGQDLRDAALRGAFRSPAVRGVHA